MFSLKVDGRDKIFNMTKLVAKNLRKVYKDREVVKNVSLDVSSGQIVGLLGAK